MSDKSFVLSGEVNIAVPQKDADKLLSLCDGTSALLYLYALRHGGSFSLSAAAGALKRTETEIKNAARLLSQHGLFASEKHEKLPLPAEELPEYTAEEIARSAREESEFPAVIEHTQQKLGKTLTGADVKTLFGIYDHLRLPVEVIMMLVTHCVEITRERSGPGRLPSMRTIEKEAYIWFNREILTMEQAEDYLRSRRRISDALGEIKHILQINNRGFSATEREYVESWLEAGFDPEAIGVAYDRTVVKTGGMQWKYMNSILNSWHAKGLHSVDEIMQGDKKGAPACGAPVAKRDDSELLRKILNKNTGK